MFPCCAGRCRRFAGISLLWISPISYAFGAEPSKTLINPLVTLGKLAIALVVVLAVFWLFARVLRQFQGYKGGMHQGLKIVGALSVGQREKIIVVQAGDEQLVLGVTSSQINTLHILDKPLLQNLPSTDSGDFKKKLNAALQRQVPGK